MAQIKVKVSTPVGTFTGFMPFDGDETLNETQLQEVIDAIAAKIETIKQLRLIDSAGDTIAFPTQTLQNSVFSFSVVED
jgi:exopolyphosphatase/pppGpp-phosphohydrolase